MAYRQIINKVLRRLREDTVDADWIGSLSENSEVDSYAQLIGDFINETKVSVEDAWQWSSLRSVVSISTIANTSLYAITGAIDRTKVLQVIDNTNNLQLKQMSDSSFYKFKFTGSQASNAPIAFRLTGTSIEFYPTPNAVIDIKIHMVLPQNDLTTAAEILTAPELPIVLGAYSLALAERGEDGGTGNNPALVRFNNTLSDAITQDQNRTIDETVWYAS